MTKKSQALKRFFKGETGREAASFPLKINLYVKANLKIKQKMCPAPLL